MAKGQKFKTPIVELNYAWINKEDTKYGGFKVTVQVPKDSAVVREIDNFAEENFPPKVRQAKSFNRGYTIDENTGKAVLRPSSTFKPAIFDAKGKQVDVQVYGGSQGIVSGVIDMSRQADKPGVKLRLNSVQVAKLVRGGSGAEDISDQIEDAYVADEDEVASPRKQEETTSAAKADADFEDDDIPF